MARMHARKKGKSGSSSPVEKDMGFVTLKAKDVEKLVVEMAKEKDMKSSMIGLILRDTHGIPSVKTLTGKSITTILKENSLLSTIPEDLDFLVKRAKLLRKHLEKNTRDVHNKRGLQLVESRIRRLTKYYKKNGKVSMEWNYK